MFDIYDWIIMACLYTGTMITAIVLYTKTKRTGIYSSVTLKDMRQFFIITFSVGTMFLIGMLCLNMWIYTHPVATWVSGRY